MAFYAHLQGQQIGRVHLLEDRTDTVDLWLPSQAPSAATDLGKIDLSSGDVEIFNAIYEIKFKALGIPVEAKVDSYFKGTIELYKDAS